MSSRSSNHRHPADSWFELGNTFSSKQQFDRAALAYTSAIECGAQDPRCYFNLGVVRTIQKRVEEAERCYGAALRLRPDYPEAHNNLAILRQFAGDIGQARRHYVQSFESPHGFPDARYNYASLLQQCGSLEEACREYQAFLKQKPVHAAAHNNLGNTLIGLGRPSEALNHFKRALALDPTTPEVRFNRAVAHLTLGHFKEGWGDYESRFHSPGRPGRRPPGTEWKGQSLQGKRLLMYAEQGLGDTLQFIRFATPVQQRGARVMLECPAVLVKMLSRMPALELVLAKDTPKPPCDFQLALLSAPHRLGVTLPSIPSAPYLAAEADLVEEWRTHLDRISGTAPLRLGLCWTGNPLHKNNRNRSMAPSVFDRLRDTPGSALFSLCPDAVDWPDLELRPLLRPLVDFEETAALIANLDLVITVDTAVAHLAGALGRPVWILLPYAADWRWLTGRDDSPWYPSAKLFRQRRPGDWGEVMDRVRKALETPR
jgi:Flp pilus assembly protein TadD